MNIPSKLTTSIRLHLLGQSLFACLMTVVAIAPQITLIPIASANELNRKLKSTPPTARPVNRSANNTPTNNAPVNDPRVLNNPNALFQPKVTITPANPSANSPNSPNNSRVAQQTQFIPQTSPPPASEERTVGPPVPQEPRAIPPINAPVQPQMPGRVQGIVPPFRRLITPPVGDIAVSTFPFTPDQVDLGTVERIGRLNLQATPAFVVLSNLARVAGLSVFPVPNTVGVGDRVPPPDQGINIPITLDIENQTVQNAFNDILRISGLQASRIGDRIFIGARLPINLQNLTTRSLRLNQITAGDASAFLISLGAERVVTRQRPIPGVQAATAVGPGGTAIVPPVQLEAIPTLERITGTSEFSKPVLQGLQVIGEERGNTLTLIGPKNLVTFAEAQLARLDIRRRQVAVNVRVLEVSLEQGQTFGTSFAFGLGAGSRFEGIGGTASIDINNAIPPQGLSARIDASIRSGQSKILTDPTLTIQEGETANVSLVQQIPIRQTTTVTFNDGVETRITTVEFSDAGLVLNVNVNRIDDNGFINLSVAPTISSPAPERTLGGVVVNPLNTRSLTTGQIRVRDNQTLFLTGVIQDEDRNEATKIPILGDIPILGALFRFERAVSNRREVVVMVTPRIIDDSQNANWGYTFQPSPHTQQVIDGNQITLPQQQDNRLNRLDQR